MLDPLNPDTYTADWAGKIAQIRSGWSKRCAKLRRRSRTASVSEQLVLPSRIDSRQPSRSSSIVYRISV
jgi:hypothetical protein